LAQVIIVELLAVIIAYTLKTAIIARPFIHQLLCISLLNLGLMTLTVERLTQK